MNRNHGILVLLGAAVGVHLLGRKILYKDPGKATPVAIPSDYFGPDVPGPATRSGPVQLAAGPLVAQPGARYQATVEVNAPASWLATVSKVRSAAEGKGFRDVVVTDARPGGWYSSAKGDYYVAATYAGQPQVLDRTYGGGQVKILDVWQI